MDTVNAEASWQLDEELLDQQTQTDSLRAEIEAVRVGGDAARLGEFLDSSFFAASLLVPEELSALLETVEPLIDVPGTRSSLTRHLQRVDVPAPIEVTAEFLRRVDDLEQPTLSDQLGALSMRLQQVSFDGRFDLAASVAGEITSAINSGRDRSGLSDVLPVIHIMVGNAHLQCGDLDAAVGSFRSASKWASADGGHPAGIYADAFVALARGLRDDGFPGDGDADGAPATPRGARGSRLLMWSSIPVLTHGLALAAGGDAAGARAALSEVGVPELTSSVEHLGQFWWLPVHLHARLAMLHEDREPALMGLRGVMQDWYTVLGRESYAGALLRADLADLLQASGALRDAGDVLAEAEAGVAIPQVLASRARQLWLSGELTGLDRLLARVGRFHQSSSSELDVLRLIRRFEIAGKVVLSAEDTQLWAAIATRATVLELSLLPLPARAALAEIDTGHAVRWSWDAVPSNPFIRSQGVRLSRGERELVLALEDGDSITALAQRLYLSPHTVKTRLRDIYRKAGVHSKEELFHVRDRVLGAAR